MATRESEEAELVGQSFLNFLKGYEERAVEGATPSNQAREYEDIVRMVYEKDRTTVEIDFKHVLNFDEDLADRIKQEFYRFERGLKSQLNVFAKQVVTKIMEDKDDAVTPEKIPEFNVAFYNIPEQLKLRDLKTDRIGGLSRITVDSGTVTRTSEVRPELVLGHFSCQDCYTEQDMTEQQFKYTEPIICKNPTCNNRKKWYLNIEKSKFVDFQRVRVQENSNEIPPGSMPRSMDIILRNEMVDRAKPGDKCTFTGSLVVVPDIAQLRGTGANPEMTRETAARSNAAQEGVTGLKDLGVRELNYKLCFLSCAVHLADKDGWSHFRDEDDEGASEELDPESIAQITKMAKSPNLYQRMVSSLCPTVFGHEEVKKGVLLMLLGGVHKTTRTKTNLRGDINVCIVGDPSTAKSQFLKYVSDFMPRAIYTSGKASSAAGLTASVIKDPETGEFGIEAGALMLADNGICCIDEFDKMDIKDQVAIHEAMEQQTISIAKAGIQATLNARTSVLAAANPRDGRYDRSKTLKSNVDISPPIMSRFDLFFVILDECDEITDYNIARHILTVHQNGADDHMDDQELSKEDLQRYIRYARTIKPRFTEDAQKRLVEHYRDLREKDCQGAQRAAYRITVRQLESMIRLSEALARLHCEKEIKVKYVDEAKRLLKMSIINVKTSDVSLDDFEAPDADEDEDGDGLGGGGGDDDDDEQGGDGGEGGDKGADEADKTPSRRSKRGREGESPGKPQDAAAKSSPSAKSPAKAASKSPAKASADEGAAAQPAKKRKLEIQQEEFDLIAIRVMGLLQAREDRGEDEYVQADLVDAYLDQQADDIESESELAHARRMVCAVIQRLIMKEHWIIVLNEDEAADMEGSPAERRNARKLAPHPNWTPPNA